MMLLLFDIDGTLLQVNGGVNEAVDHAVSNITGCSLQTDSVSFSGRTDPEIFRDVLQTTGIQEPDPLLDDVIHTYAEAATDTIQPSHVESLPGIPSLLSALSKKNDVHLGLLTGNVEPIAHHKLQSVELDHHFSTGAYGSDHPTRSELPAIAVQRASAHTGRPFSLQETTIIGDTRHDIHCARVVGSRSVAVCTGRFGRSDLEPHAPDHLLEDFRDYRTFIEQILEL